MSKLYNKVINEKLDEVFDKLNDANESKSGFNLRKVRTGECRYYSVHENKTRLENLHSLSTKADLKTRKKWNISIAASNALKNVTTKSGASNW